VQHRANEASKRLQSIHGIDIIGASAISATVTDPKAFRSGRDFAAWIGLVPRQDSTGGKQKLGPISKMKTYVRNGSRPSIGKPASCHARKEGVLVIGTDQWITSGPAARTAAFRGRMHGCTRTFREDVRFFSLAPRAPSIHGTKCGCRHVRYNAAVGG